MSRADSIGFFWEDIKEVKQKKELAPKRTPPERTWEEDSYLPNFEIAKNFNYDFYTDRELVVAQTTEPLVWDIECYPNYFLIAFMGVKSKKITLFEQGPNSQIAYQRLEWIINNFLLIGFNSHGYDLPLLAGASKGFGTRLLKEMSDAIIKQRSRPREIYQLYKLKKPIVNSIDLIELGQLRASLKLIAARSHEPVLQELPFDPDKILNNDQITVTRWYCINDLSHTRSFSFHKATEIALRYNISAEYNADVRSSSDAQIAEVVLGSQIKKRIGYVKQPEIEVGRIYKYLPPNYLNFQSAELQHVFNLVKSLDFVVDEYGKLQVPEQWDSESRLVRVGNSCYKMGIGGLHSTEEFQAHVANNGYRMTDVDVKSFYPRIIINNRYHPEHLKDYFLIEYTRVVDRRLRAQAIGNEVESSTLKITINGTFGKFGSPYSILYAPHLVMLTTITGQFSLLLLIEKLYANGINVISANTDGVTAYYKEDKELVFRRIVKEWENLTYFETEKKDYYGLFNRDVNNYFAIQTDNKIKAKGVFLSGNLNKNPSGDIIIRAVKEYVVKGTPILATLKESRDIREFLFVRQVKGGAVKVWGVEELPSHDTKEDLIIMVGFQPMDGDPGHWFHPQFGWQYHGIKTEIAYRIAKDVLWNPTHTEYLGKVVRWYYSNVVKNEIVYASSGNKVAKSENSRPVAILPSEFPIDVDYERYEQEALEYLKGWGMY